MLCGAAAAGVGNRCHVTSTQPISPHPLVRLNTYHMHSLTTKMSMHRMELRIWVQVISID